MKSYRPLARDNVVLFLRDAVEGSIVVGLLLTVIVLDRFEVLPLVRRKAFGLRRSPYPGPR